MDPKQQQLEDLMESFLRFEAARNHYQHMREQFLRARGWGKIEITPDPVLVAWAKVGGNALSEKEALVREGYDEDSVRSLICPDCGDAVLDTQGVDGCPCCGYPDNKADKAESL